MAEAARLFGAAAAIRERTESPLLAVHRSAYERDLDAVRTALGADEFTSLLTQGETISAEAIPALLARCRHRIASRATEAPVISITR